MARTKLYFAPMEGITGYTFRKVHCACYPGIDLYFSPFISPNQHHAVNPKEQRDVCKEHNQGVPLIPQILTNKPELMLAAARELKQKYGYEEVNLNLGCPSKTVVSKGKGSGFLAEPDRLERFFEEVFAKTEASKGEYPRLSVKTRLGMDDVTEFEELLRIYNKFPLSELIIHPRVQKEFYKGVPHTEVFAEAVANSPHSLCYNGDISTLDDFIYMKEQFPSVEKVMIGRGLLANPALAQEISAYETCMEAGQIWYGYQVDLRQVKKYHDMLFEGYLEQMSGDTNVLFKMKELWLYLGGLFPEEERLIKKMKKAGKLTEYEELAKKLFQ